MATVLSEQLSYRGSYADSSMGPVANIAELTGLTHIFQGLTVSVLSPVPMEVWLRDGKTRGHWRIKRFKPFATYSDLQTKTSAIVEESHGLFEKGVEASVLADETNNGEYTKYYVKEKTKVNDVWTLTWERISGGGSAITIDGDDTKE